MISLNRLKMKKMNKKKTAKIFHGWLKSVRKYERELLAVLAIVLMASVVSAADLKWDASTGADGYKIYYNSNSKLVSETQIDITELNLIPGIEYTMSVTAWNQMGESAPSNSVLYMLPSFTPGENPSAVIHIPGPVTIIVE